MTTKPRIPMYIAVQLERGWGDSERRIWLPLPATKKEFQEAQEAIGAEYGDFGISEYNVRVPGLYRGMLSEAPLSQVNFLAARLAMLDDDQLFKLAAIIDSERYFTELEQVIDYTYTSDRYQLLSGVKNEADLGRLYLDAAGIAPVFAGLRKCIDPYMLGKYIADEQDGQFTALGYLTTECEWNTAPWKWEVPDALKLTGIAGEELYGDDEIDE